jgi:acyl-coenzyme A synthetase/AMP-(fatty) acid ligase
MGLLSGIGKVVGNIGKQLSKGVEYLRQPLDVLLAPVKKFAGDIGGAVAGDAGRAFVNKHFDKAVAWLAAAELGAIGLIAKALPTVQKIAEFAEQIKQASDRLAEKISPEGKTNMAHIMAQAQSKLI